MDSGAMERLLALQLAMNRLTWEKLTSLGVRPHTPLVLDFTFGAAGRAPAEALAAFLQQQTDYHVEADQLESPPGAWGVFGSTRSIHVAPEFLDEWVRWMVTAGCHYQCEFDGWGTNLGKPG